MIMEVGMKTLCVYLIFIVWIIVIVTGCGGGDSGPTSPSQPYTLTLAVENSSNTSTTLSLTSSFSCIDCPIFRDGYLYLKITTTANTPSYFTVDNSAHCYQSGGNLFLIGEIWSNIVCTP